MPAAMLPASRRTGSRGAASPAPFRSCSRSPACRCATIFWSARICVIPPVPRRSNGRKRLELARALATEPKLLLLDEVLAGLNPSEIRDIVPVIRALSARGIAVLMIEHVMQAVMSLAEHVFVLAEGRIIAQGSPAQVVADPVVVEAYLGHGAAARVGGAHVD
jgi:hypothetical protein